MNKNKMRILLIEDNPLDARLVKEYLEDFGLESNQLINDGTLSTAIQKLAEDKFDIILLDLNLPDSVGYETFNKINRFAKDTPIILFTSVDDEELVAKVISEGAQDYLTKGQISSTLLYRTILFSIERKKSEKKLFESEERFRKLSDESLIGNLFTSPDGKITLCNPAYAHIFGFNSVEEALTHNVNEFYLSSNQREELLSNLTPDNNLKIIEERLKRIDGKFIDVIENVFGAFDAEGNLTEIKRYIFDNTERKRSEQRDILTSKILAILNKQNEWNLLFRDILFEIKQFTQFDAAAIRLKEGKDFPYFVHEGFTDTFINEKNFLCTKNRDSSIVKSQSGDPNLECTCGVVLSGKMDKDKPYFTESGSFWTNQSSDLLDLKPGEELRSYPINNCIHSGYMSVALIPIHSGNDIIGILQLNDKRSNMFEKGLIEYFEGIGNTIGIAYKRMLSGKIISESEENYRLIAEYATDVIWVLDMETRTFRYVSPSIERLLGFTDKEFINRSVAQTFTPESFRYIQENSPIRIERMLNGDTNIYTDEIKVVHKNGNIITTEINHHFITNPYTGRIEGTGVMRDITERKKVQDKLLMLSKALEQSPVAIVITDLNSKIEYVNLGFTRQTGYSLEEALGKNPNILNSGHHSSEFYKKIYSSMLAGNVFQCEMLNKKKNGELYWEYSIFSPILNEQNVITHFVAVKEDITEKKQMVEDLILAKDEAEKANELKTEFLAQISHEIRSPMNAIISFANLLKEELSEKMTPDHKEYFDGIDSAGHRLIRTVDMILNSSELQIGTYEPTFTEVALIGDILRKVESEFDLSIAKKGLQYDFISDVEEVVILGDRYSIYQLFVNLMDNAIKYTKLGSISVRVEKNEELVKVSIVDTGIGMSEDFMTKIYTPFAQEYRGYSRSYEGNGLGLSLVKKYCEINKINIDVESRKGIGSKFTLIFTEIK